MTERKYKIQHKYTKQCIDKIVPGSAWANDHAYILYNDTDLVTFRDIYCVNVLIRGAVTNGLQVELADCELLTFEIQAPKLVRTSIKLDTMLARHEKAAIIERLKGN